MDGNWITADLSSTSDAELIRRIHDGDAIAFDQLMGRHKDRVFNWCYRFLGDYQDADDAAQEAFVKVYRSAGSFRFRSAFTTWLYRIVVNTCRNKVKSAYFRQKQKSVSIDGMEHQRNPDGHAPRISDANPSPEGRLRRREQREIMEKAIQELAEDQRTAVLLRDIEGLHYEEIGRITGVRPGTVKSRIARGRAALRRRLRSLFDNDV